MYTEFYGFREKPFNIVPDPHFLYLSTKHRTALTYLEYGLMEKIDFILLTGEIGTGKTTLIKQLLTRIDPNFEIALIVTTRVSSEELLHLILQEFELEVPVQSKARSIDVLQQFLIRKYSEGQRVTLIVDEAQNLSLEALEEVRMLSNLHAGRDALLQIVLVGQPALRVRLRDPLLAQLNQRIAVSYHLAPLTVEDTREYIIHRLKTAGCKREILFTQEAIERIFQESGGIPRSINILCDAALVYGYADERVLIDTEIIKEVVHDKQGIGLSPVVPLDTALQAIEEDSIDDADVLRRIQRLEDRLNKVCAMIDWQMRQNESDAGSHKDTVIHKLEQMLDEERKRMDTLLQAYNRLLSSRNGMELFQADATISAREPESGNTSRQ